jgi:AraC-like DNA-binding protein
MRQNELDDSMLEKKLAFKKEQFAIIHPNSLPHLLFEHLEEVCFFAKDRDGLLFASNATLLKRYNLQDEYEITGRTDFDFVSRSIAEKYRKDDLEVMNSRKPMLNIVELALNAVGIPDWCSTNKLPIFSISGDVIGVMGTIQSYRFNKSSNPALPNFQDILQYISDNYSRRITIRELAQTLNMSVRSFERTFKDVFNITPQQFIIKTRIFKACDQLREGMSISESALHCGFYDQSSFAKLFKRHMGLTPLQYIKHFLRDGK